MASLYTEQDKNVWKTWLLMGFMFALVTGVGLVLSNLYNNEFIFYGAFGLSVIANVGGYWFSDRIALSMASAHPADSIQFKDLHNIVENLAITAGLPKPAIYIINDPAPNAFATGRNKDHAAVAVTTGLLSMLSRTELEGVIAHELAHIGNRDILIGTVAVVLAGLVSVVSNIFIRSNLGGDRNNKNPLLLMFGIVLIILAPIGATLIRLAISRKREFLADASGALLTRYPEGLASALEKISSYPNPLQSASDATAHLYISNPFGAKALKGLHGLFATHPHMEDRVRILRDMK